MAESHPIIRGFFSYSRQNDSHDGGTLSLLRKSLEMESWDQSGEETEIFQDQDDIYWGQQWKEKITKALDVSNFFIAVITPSYLRSESCRFEFEYFLEREKRLGGERILPLLYIETLALQRRFALLRRFEYYYDILRGTPKFPSYTPWRMLQKGDCHEKDYSTCSIPIAFGSSTTI